MRVIMSSIEGEWRRYKLLAERAIDQLQDRDLAVIGPGGGNSIAMIVTHIAGNLQSRFTDFLTTDGEKAWRDRESEFQQRPEVSREELMARWNEGWRTLFAELEPLQDEDLRRTVKIRGEEFEVHDALHRLLTHTSYHVGQIVYVARCLRSGDWKWLTIPPGKSEEYNRNPQGQRPPKK